jgi:hypothetical protein
MAFALHAAKSRDWMEKAAARLEIAADYPSLPHTRRRSINVLARHAIDINVVRLIESAGETVACRASLRPVSPE